MERTVYDTAPPFPPPDPSELRVLWDEDHAQVNGQGWLALLPGRIDARHFFKQRSALRWVTRDDEGNLR